MKINKDHPEYVKFIKNELNTLRFLKDQAFIINDFNELNCAADQCYSQFNGRIKNNKNVEKFNFEFEANFNMPIEEKSRQVFIGANINSNYSQVSYMLAFCESDELYSNLIRKYHFDYEINNGKTKKPTYHFQFGGKLTPLMNSSNVKDEYIQSWLSIPRINYTPINLALLLDLIFVEFKSQSTVGVTERSEWRDFVKMNEDFMLKDYYKTVNSFFSGGEHTSKKLFRDFSYGE